MALWDGFGGVVERCGRTIISYYVKVSGVRKGSRSVGTGCAVWPNMLVINSAKNQPTPGQPLKKTNQPANQPDKKTNPAALQPRN